METTNNANEKMNELLDILNDIAMSLRIMSGRSKVTNVTGKNTYKDFYFSQSDTENDK